MTLAIGSERKAPPDARRTLTLGVAAGVLIAVAIGTAALVRAPDPAARPPASGLQIAVIQPPAPPIDPGARMEVGELVDGYVHRPIPAVSSEMDPYGLAYQTAWIEPEPHASPSYGTRDEVWGTARAEVPVQAPAAVSTGSDAGNWLGFDAPQPDYAAERRARQARLERLESERVALPPSPEPIRPALRTETAFY